MSISELPVAGTADRGSQASAEPAKKRRGHQHELDIVRTVTFGGVILDHCVSGTTAAESLASNAVQTVLHYTRNAFFALTGFVLVYQYRDRELKATAFWARRFKLIGLPYLAWSVFYWLFGIYAPAGTPESLGHFADAFGSMSAAVESVGNLAYLTFTGNAWYHLYFVFVTMQVYLVFPLFLKFLRWSWGFHRYVLAASFAFHLALMEQMTTNRPALADDGVLNALWTNLHHTVFPYQFYILGGALAAMHLEGFRAWIVQWRKWVVVLTGAALVLVAWNFRGLVVGGMLPHDAANVFRPYVTFLFVGIVMSLYAVGTMWSERRTPGSFWDTFLAKASDRSFAIFLVHALALQLLAPLIQHFRFDVYPPIVTAGAFLGTVALTVALVEVLRRTPLSLITTGRERIAPPKERELITTRW